MRAAVEQVELADRRAAEPVDHQRDVVALAERQVRRRRLDQLVDDLVRVGELLAPAPRLAVDADAHLHLVVAELEQRRALGGRRARREGHAHRPGDRVDRSPSATRSSSSAPFSDAAPIALITKKLPATPRRPTVHVESFTATSSSTMTVPIRDPLCLGHLGAHLERHAVPRVVVDQVEHALLRS